MTDQADDWPSVGIVVINWNNYEETAECLDSLARLEYPDYRVVVVDNGSTDGSGQRLAAEFDWCEVVFNEKNRGFGGGCNSGIDHALSGGAEFVFLLNNDAVVDKDFLRELVTVARESGASVVGARVRDEHGDPVNPVPNRYPDMFFYSGYRSNLPFTSGSEGASNVRWRETDRVEGAGVLLSRELLEARKQSLGYYIDDSLFMYCEEIELAMWCRDHGYESVIATEAIVDHIGDASSTRAFQLYYLTRNRILIAHRYLSVVSRLLFDVLYAVSRLALAGRQARNGRRDVAEAILAGLVDGYRSVDGKRQEP